MADNLLTFPKVKATAEVGGNYYEVRNQKDELLGYIEKLRMGRFLHWCLETKGKIRFSNGCLKEITRFITSLYGKDRKEASCAGD